MEKVDNNFEERLKRYSEEIKSMEIVYHEGRVKCISKKETTNFKSRKTQDKHINKKSYNKKDDLIIDNEEYTIIKNMYSLILKLIFTCIILISLPLMANKFANMGMNEFISGIGSMFICYFIINIIWVFLE